MLGISIGGELVREKLSKWRHDVFLMSLKSGKVKCRHSLQARCSCVLLDYQLDSGRSHKSQKKPIKIDGDRGYGLRFDREDSSVGGTPHSGTPFGRAILFGSYSSSATHNF